MKGKILDFNIQNASGVISGDDGQRYNFSSSEWKSDKAPTANQIVDFTTEEDNAMGIYLVASEKKIDVDVDTIKDNLSSVMKDGIHNKAGVIVSLMLAFSLFFKIIDAGFLGSASFMDGIEGWILFVFILITTYLHFSGIREKFLKIASVAISAGIFIKLIYVFVKIGTAIIPILSFGAYIIPLLTIAFLIIGLKAKEK
jgi:hypothetical protein